MAIEAGTRLGRVVVREYVASGATGAVYRALGEDHGVVVVKVLHGLAEPESLERFRQVAPRLAAALHANLVRVLAHGEHEGVPYLVVASIDGITLAERLRRATLGPAAALELLRGTAAGIDHAHAAGLVHGNLKPAQVLLAAGDRPVVSDFGLAPLRRPRPAGPAGGGGDGTPEYLAPEQVAGGEPTAASDRYAFAAIAYQLLVDRTPFEGEPQSVMDAQLRAKPVPPSCRNRALPPAIDAVLLLGLAKQPAGRWPTCAQLVDAMAEALDLAPRSVPAPAPAPAPPPPAGRRRPWPLIVVGGLAVVALGVAVGALSAGHARQGTTRPPVMVATHPPSPRPSPSGSERSR